MFLSNYLNILFIHLYFFLEEGKKYASITQCILYFICKDSHPFNAVTGVGFQKLIHELSPSFKISHPDTFKAKMEEKYCSMKVLYETKLSTIQHICLTFDIWTETMQMKSFLGGTAHFLDGIKLSSICIATRPLFDRHTALYITQQLKCSFENFCKK